jgi:hypothetical protein
MIARPEPVTAGRARLAVPERVAMVQALAELGDAADRDREALVDAVEADRLDVAELQRERILAVLRQRQVDQRAVDGARLAPAVDRLQALGDAARAEVAERRSRTA